MYSIQHLFLIKDQTKKKSTKPVQKYFKKSEVQKMFALSSLVFRIPIDVFFLSFSGKDALGKSKKFFFSQRTLFFYSRMAKEIIIVGVDIETKKLEQSSLFLSPGKRNHTLLVWVFLRLLVYEKEWLSIPKS